MQLGAATGVVWRFLLLTFAPITQADPGWALVQFIIIMALGPVLGVLTGSNLASALGLTPIPGTAWMAALMMGLLLIAGVRVADRVHKYEMRSRPQFFFEDPYIDQRALVEVMNVDVPGVRTSAWPAINTALPETMVFENPFGATRPLISNAQPDERSVQPIDRTRAPQFAHVRIRNDPSRRDPAADAQDVIARVAFFVERGHQLREILTIDGRWGDAEQPATMSPIASLEHLRRAYFRCNGEHHELDLIVKHYGDAKCYPVTDYDVRAGWRHPEHAIDADEIFIRVTLQGTNTDSDPVAWFKIKNPGRYGQLVAERSPAPTADH
jgi:hypothetical protein